MATVVAAAAESPSCSSFASPSASLVRLSPSIGAARSPTVTPFASPIPAPSPAPVRYSLASSGSAIDSPPSSDRGLAYAPAVPSFRGETLEVQAHPCAQTPSTEYFHLAHDDVDEEYMSVTSQSPIASEVLSPRVDDDIDDSSLLRRLDDGSAFAIRHCAQYQEAIKWYALERGGRLTIHPAGNALLSQESGCLNLVVTAGRTRTGKSYILNALLGGSCFETSAGLFSTTHGVDLCPVLFQRSNQGLRQLRSDLVSRHQDGEEAPLAAASVPADPLPRVAFADSEGFGACGAAHDTALLAPLLLVAKVVLLQDVCGAGPSPETLFDQLKAFLGVARTLPSRKERRALFGHLHIVLRDCEQSEEECRRILFDTEDPNQAVTDEHAAAINSRNGIRADIQLCFQGSPRVWCLPKIPTTEAPTDCTQAPPGYVAKIAELRLCLGKQLATPKFLGEQALTGAGIAALLPALADAMQAPEPALHLQSLVAMLKSATEAPLAHKKTPIDSRLGDLTSVGVANEAPRETGLAHLRACLEASDLERRRVACGAFGVPARATPRRRTALWARTDAWLLHPPRLLQPLLLHSPVEAVLEITLDFYHWCCG